MEQLQLLPCGAREAKLKNCGYHRIARRPEVEATATQDPRKGQKNEDQKWSKDQQTHPKTKRTNLDAGAGEGDRVVLPGRLELELDGGRHACSSLVPSSNDYPRDPCCGCETPAVDGQSKRVLNAIAGLVTAICRQQCHERERISYSKEGNILNFTLQTVYHCKL